MTDQDKNFWAGIIMCFLFFVLFTALIINGVNFNSTIIEKDQEIDRLLYKQYEFQCEVKEQAPNPNLDCKTFSLCNQLIPSEVDSDILVMKCFKQYRRESY